MLDVVLACAYPCNDESPGILDRKAFEERIANGTDVNQKVKAALLSLSPEDRDALFQ
jgi:hypothetical protein